MKLELVDLKKIHRSVTSNEAIPIMIEKWSELKRMKEAQQYLAYLSSLYKTK
jgi:hypothetical protein